MELRTFAQVWYRDSPSTWSELLAMKDSGPLEIRGPDIEFRGSTRTIVIHSPLSASIGRQGLDFVNAWVRIDYAEGDQRRVAYFADGSALGWGGVLGGTKKLYEAVQSAIGVARAQAARPRG